MLINYEDPEIKDEMPKPEALPGGLPYHNLPSSRRFEELLFLIYKNLIDKIGFNSFEDIKIMNGVREKGRDCVLLKGGKNYGLIQCKKYGDNLSKRDFGTEITKFAMYSLLEDSLIHNLDDFSYYIAVSKDYTMDCGEFIDDFGDRIIVEDDLNLWIGENLKNPTMAPLKLRDTLKEVKNVLRRIKVKRIQTQELDQHLLSPPCRELISMFFDVQKVITGDINDIINFLGQNVPFVLNREQLLSQLETGSLSLTYEQNEFEEIPDSHISRIETSYLADWVNSPLMKNEMGKAENICLLAANAGMGKTVILKDLYDILQSSEVPIMALKADKIYAIDLKGLQHKLDLKLPVLDFIEKCKEEFSKIILIIDQIDALSLSMSADPSFLRVYKTLIDRYTHDPCLRIIISVRIFDLNNDPTLRVYKNIKTIIVAPLSQQLVLEQLKKIGIEKSSISQKCLELLQVPSHLNIFSQIYKDLTDYSSISSMQDLYSSLWDVKVKIVPPLGMLKSVTVIDCLYKIASEMFKRQCISVPEAKFDRYSEVIRYLYSERLIKKEGGQLQFFHQSFYDYIFSRWFVEKGGKVTKYVLDNHQSLMIRSALKMVINYLRDYDAPLYVKYLGKFLASKKFHFHVKHVLVSSLAYQENPMPDEINILKQLIWPNIHLSNVFFEHVIGDKWFSEFLKNQIITTGMIADNRSSEFSGTEDYLAGYHSYLIRNLIRVQVLNDNPVAWDFALSSLDVNVKKEVIFYLEKWNSNGFKLLGQIENYEETDPLSYYLVLEKIIIVDPLFVFEKIQHRIKKCNENLEELDEQFLKIVYLISNIFPEKIFPIFLERIKGNLKCYPDIDRIMPDLDYRYTDLYEPISDEEEEGIHERHSEYQLTARSLRLCAKKSNPMFIRFFEEEKSSMHEPIWRLLFFSLKGSEKNYTIFLLPIMKHLMHFQKIYTDGDISLCFRDFLEAIFSNLSIQDEQWVVDAIMNYNPKEYFIDKHGDATYRHSFVGKTKYSLLSRVPIDSLRRYPKAYLEYVMLQRKFSGFEEISLKNKPLQAKKQRSLTTDQFLKMKNPNWLALFFKFDSDKRKDGEELTLHSCSWAFKEHVLKFPTTQMIELIRALLNEPKINVQYSVMGLLGLSEAKWNAEEVLELLTILLEKEQDIKSIHLILSICRYVINSGFVNEDIFLFVSQQAHNLSDSDEQIQETETYVSERNFFIEGINTNYGYAASMLSFITDQAFANQVFFTLENRFQNAPALQRSTIMHYSAYLLNIDQERAYSFFLNATEKERNLNVIAASLWSMEYFAQKIFSELTPIFASLIQVKDLNKDYAFLLFKILFAGYLKGKTYAVPLIRSLVKLQPVITQMAARQVFKNFYFDDNAAEKCRGLLSYINSYHEGVRDQKTILPLNEIEHINISDIRDFLEEYFDMPRFSISHQLVKYLTLQCKSNPKVVIPLFRIAMEKSNFEKVNNGLFRSDELVGFVAAAYTALKESDKESLSLKKELLTTFDIILKDPKLKNRTNKFLDDLII